MIENHEMGQLEKQSGPGHLRNRHSQKQQALGNFAEQLKRAWETTGRNNQVDVEVLRVNAFSSIHEW